MAYTTYLTKSGANNIGIKSIEFAEDLQNQIRKRAKGNRKSNQTAVPITKIVDKKKYFWSLTISGHLECDSDANYPTALNKRDALLGSSPLGMLFTSGAISLYHRAVEYVGTIEKMQIKDSAERLDKTGGGTEKYNITLTMLIGTVR